ncbi:MAG: CotH kinase family protein [Bacteroidales bacterium]|nr:CotH kinase family protein [Bacteroidales bacterium]MBN2819829.1 CotH kinase family protein [Bacteroidales bacterium]
MKAGFKIVFILFFHAFVEQISAQVIINEIQSSNVQTISDNFGEFPDWIELFNNSDSVVNLEGWFLSDDRKLLTRWTLPAISLQPNEFVYIFASGRDISVLPSVWTTAIDVGEEYNYLVPTDTVSWLWKTTAYNDSEWLSGKSGFGYADEDDSTVVTPPVTSIYLRKEFEISNLSKTNSALLHVDYDDGFVAYINGLEVARANLGDAGSEVAYDQFTSLDREAQMWQGGQPELFDISAFLNVLNTGTNLFCVEVHNVGASSSDLSIIPFLSFGKTVLDEGDNAVSDFLNLGRSVPHTNFKLKSEGETIFLSNSLAEIIDSVSSVVIPPDYSYGKVTGTESEYGYFANPTPGSVNEYLVYQMLTDDSIVFSKKGGYYQSTISLSLSALVEGQIYYTVDGTDPSENSVLYSGEEISVSGNTIVRARILKEGYLSGNINSRTYFFDHHADLPVICLSTDPNNLWDYNNGMYVLGPNAESSDPHFGANYWMDWEKPMNIELYDEDGNMVINQLSGAKIFGAWSRARDQKSFAFFARKNYGKNKFSYPLFKQKDLSEYKSFIIRNSGNDWDNAYMRDGLITDLTSHLGVDYQAFQPVVAYLNAEYWGMYNMREKVNEDYLEANRGIDADEFNILENEGIIVEGTNEGYLELLDFLETNSSLANKADYDYVASKIDIDNFIKYQLIEIYVGNNDWPGNNIKYYNTNSEGSKFKWILYDTDFGFGLYDAGDYSRNFIDFALAPNNSAWPNPEWSTLLFRRLVTNLEFRNNFINQMADNINTTFQADNINRHVDSIKNLVKDEMVYHLPRWNQSYNDWGYQVERLKDWGDNRIDYARQHIRTTFNLSAQHVIGLSVSNKSMGRIRLNTIKPDLPFSGVYFRDVPVEIEAIPLPGYKFSHWEGDVNSANRVLKYNPEKNVWINAVFEEAAEEDVSLVINEINYNSSQNVNPSDWIEIYNNSNTTANIGGYVFTDSEIDSGYGIPEGTVLNAGAYLVLSKNISNFEEVFPDVKNVIGEFDFGLSSKGDELRLYNANYEVMDAVDYLSTSPWPLEANGTGATLELMAASMDNGKAESWIANTRIFGTPGQKNSGTSVLPEINIEDNNDIQFNVFPTRFSDYITINFSLQTSSHVKLEILNIQGSVVNVLENRFLENGDYNNEWIPDSSIKGGVYFIRLIIKYQVITKKIVFIK